MSSLRATPLGRPMGQQDLAAVQDIAIVEDLATVKDFAIAKVAIVKGAMLILSCHSNFNTPQRAAATLHMALRDTRHSEALLQGNRLPHLRTHPESRHAKHACAATKWHYIPELGPAQPEGKHSETRSVRLAEPVIPFGRSSRSSIHLPAPASRLLSRREQHHLIQAWLDGHPVLIMAWAGQECQDGAGL
eukprot:309229-Pelagomonas_calceolata.AAC.2